MLSLLEHQFELQRITVRRELSEQPVVVLGTEHKLQQVFLNLFLNAKDAMPKGGWLSIATRTEDGQAVVEVSDTGSGIPSEYLARIYDPVLHDQGDRPGHRPRPVDHLRHRARARRDDRLRQRLGQGTRFTLRFPLAPAERLARAAPVNARAR